MRTSVVATPGLLNTGSIIAAHGLRFSAHEGSFWIRSVSALMGGFFTTESPGKPPQNAFNQSTCTLVMD